MHIIFYITVSCILVIVMTLAPPPLHTHTQLLTTCCLIIFCLLIILNLNFLDFRVIYYRISIIFRFFELLLRYGTIYMKVFFFLFFEQLH
jgi:hypothetical protein